MIHKNLCLLVAIFLIAVPAFGQPLEPGDSDQDYDFDPYDIVLMQQGAKFGTGQAATWQDGDWDGGPGGEAGSPPVGDGVVDRADVDAADATKNYLGEVYAKVKVAPFGASDPILPGGASDDNQTSIAYFNDTGVIAIDAPNGRQLSTILIESKSGIFNGVPAENVGANVFDIDTNTRIFRTIFGGGFSTFSLGAVAEKQHSVAFLLDDLKVSGALRGGGGLGPVDLVFLGPPLPDVLPGDADQDYDVDPYDFVQVLQAGKFGTGEPANWDEGDWNAVGGPPGNPPAGDGFFDEVDLEIMFEVGQYRQGPYGPQETPRGQGTRVFAGGVLGDDRVSIVYVGETGEVALDVPPGVELTSIVLDTGAAFFTGLPPENLGGPLDVDDDRQLVKMVFSGGFSSLSFGRAAAPGQELGLVARFFSATGSRAGGGDLGLVDLVFFEEDPGFRRGDANADGRVDIADVALIYHSLVPILELGSFPCVPAADANSSGNVDAGDSALLLRWLSGGVAPGTPGPFECGQLPNNGLVQIACFEYPVILCGGLPERQEDDRFSFRFGDVPETIGGGPGTTETFEVVVQICNELPVRAWSVGVVADGDITITNARTEGTLAAGEADGPLKVEVVAVNHVSDKAMSYVVLGANQPRDMPPTENGVGCEPRDVLILTIQAMVPPDGAGVGSLEFVDELDITGTSIDNIVSYLDGTGTPRVAKPQLERRTFSVGSPACPPNPVKCTELAVKGPVGGGPGIYEAFIFTADGGGSPLYRIGAEKGFGLGEGLDSGILEENFAQFELTEGTWTFRGSVTDGFECVADVCDEVTVVVQCVEEPDSVSISGLTEAQVGSVVEIVATFQGLDPGAVVNGYTWQIVEGDGQLVGTAGPVARVRSSVPGEVAVLVSTGDSLCQDVSVARHEIVFKEECPATLRADCQNITVTGPENEGPGEYVITVAATFPAGLEPLYFFRIENPATGERADAGPVPGRVARIPDLPPGTWIISAAAGVEPECPFDACSPVEVVVRCLEEPDSVVISGADEAQVGAVVELAASLDGADAGGTATYQWEVVSGAGEFVGASNKSTVDVMGATGGEVTVRVRSGDGVCEDEAEAVHTILFQDCVPPGSISCGGVEVEGPPGNAPGEYRVTVTATVPANETALYFYRIENPQNGQSATAGPGPSSQVTATLPVGTWDVSVAVGTDPDCPFVTCAPVRVVITETPVGEVGPFIRSDCNADQRLNLADAICVLDWLLLDGARPGCLAVANTNGDGDIDTSDAIYVLLFLTAGGAEPVAPFPSCGLSATGIDQALGCENSPSYCQ